MKKQGRGASMAIPKRQKLQDYQEDEEEELYSDSGESESDPDSDMGSDFCGFLKETRGRLSDLSIEKKPISRAKEDAEQVDERSLQKVQEIVQGGQIEKLKVDECKVYLRTYGLRLTGNKDTLIERIKEHQEVLNGGGEKKYPASSFTLNCQGDACTGDVVMFKQNVYEKYNIASRSASGPPSGTRTVAGRIVKESYGSSKQQHTFTIEVLWSKGEKPLPPLHPLLIKGRNLYRYKTLRQRWDDEEERHKVLMEKHSRGSHARFDRETRIQDREKKKLLRENRPSKREQPSKNSQSNTRLSIRAVQGREAEKSGSSVSCGKVAPKPQQSGLSVDSREMVTITHKIPSISMQKMTLQARKSEILIDAVKMGDEARKLAIQPEHFRSSTPGVIVGMRPHQTQVLPQHSRQSTNQVKTESGIQHPSIGLKNSGTPVRTGNLVSGHEQLTIRTCQSDFSVESGKQAPELLKVQYGHDNLVQNPHNGKMHNSIIQKVQRHGSDNIHARWPNFYMNNNFSPSENLPRKEWKNEVLERSCHRQCLQHREDYQKHKLCRHYVQGRCYYGDNCKFLHESRQV